MSYSLMPKADEKKITSQGCPSEAGEKIYYFNYSCYYLDYFLIGKPTAVSWQLILLKAAFLQLLTSTDYSLTKATFVNPA